MKIIYLLWVNIIKYSIILINMVHNLWKVCPNLSSQKKIRKNMLIQYEKSLSLNYFTLGGRLFEGGLLFEEYGMYI